MLRKKEEIKKALILRRKKKEKLKNDDDNNNNSREEKVKDQEKEKEKEKEKDEKTKGNNLKKYNYIILKGNNSVCIKKCMNHRINWKELIDNKSLFYNLKWRPISSGKDFFNLLKSPYEPQITNHYEYHTVISNKLNLFQNIMKFCEVIKIEKNLIESFF